MDKYIELHQENTTMLVNTRHIATIVKSNDKEIVGIIFNSDVNNPVIVTDKYEDIKEQMRGGKD